MDNLVFCKNCGFVDGEGRLDATDIQTICSICGGEVEDPDIKLKQFGNALLKVFRPATKARFI